MGRHPSNGAPSFRFTSAEVTQMETILRNHDGQVPPRDFLAALAQNFSTSQERSGKSVVQMKQVWSWFQNRRYALRAKTVEATEKPTSSPFTPVTRDTPARNVSTVPQQVVVPSGRHVAGNTSEPPVILEYEAKSARDGAWYDVQVFLNLRNLETSKPEVLVRFSGFGEEDDEWIDILKHVRPRSLPCEASECIVVNPGDLILCFQEGKEQALYYDAHVLDAQRRRHDVRGCRCRFLVRYDHDQSEEIVPLRKICRRPETDFRLKQLNAVNETAVPVQPPPNSAPTVVRASTPSRLEPPAATTVMGPSMTIPAPLPVSGPYLAPVAALPAQGSPAIITVSGSVSEQNKVVCSPISVQTLIPEEKKIEIEKAANLVSISVSDQKKTETEGNKVETVNPTPLSQPAFIPVSETYKVERDSPIPESEPKTVQSENPDLVSEPNKVDVESEIQIPVDDSNKGNVEREIQIPVDDPNKGDVERDIQIPVDEPNKVNVESDIEIPVGESNVVQSDNLTVTPVEEKAEESTPNAGVLHHSGESVSIVGGGLDPTGN